MTDINGQRSDKGSVDSPRRTGKIPSMSPTLHNLLQQRELHLQLQSQGQSLRQQQQGQVQSQPKPKLEHHTHSMGPTQLPPPPIQPYLPPSIIYRKLPREFIKCQKKDLITIVSRMLSSLIEINDRQSAPNLKYIDHASLTRFHSRSPPQITVFNYLYRLSHFSSLENSILITAVYYIDLLTRCYPVFAINSLTVHRFLLTATTVASKSLCDSFCSNHHYSKVGGVNIMELNLLEAEFLTKVNYRVVPRDFNYDFIGERRSSTGTLDADTNRNVQHGITCAAEILDLYYRRMVMLVGGMSKDVEDNDLDDSNENGNHVFIGHDDSVVFYLGDDDEQYFQDTEPAPVQYYSNEYIDSSTDNDSSPVSDSLSSSDSAESLQNPTGQSTEHPEHGDPICSRKRGAEDFSHSKRRCGA
ncbi:hypothetical protein FOA43_003098 [Brettanomyces nanus]|uniref:Cyclin n=1 Tax=Eeniella nana TaxID=13502 RepID=A0A875S453_EENNA|nr:uncharacterized protein FOA43_003098 [Brettanomyces nanus]QPG75738.1 hypothetical protein FOA43_003098 [Brettanomyces nanus]